MQSLVVFALLAAAADGFRTRRKGREPRREAVKPAAEEEEQRDEAQSMFDEAQIILLPDSFPKCFLTNSTCDLKDMKEATLVYPNTPDTKCFNGEQFAFLVHPGATDKLLYYFPGGGACWDLPHINLEVPATICFPDMITGLTATGYGLGGVMDYTRDDNVFKDYTYVSPAYCNGGAHVANTTVKALGKTYYQHDYNNNEAARSWAKRNMDDSLKSFVIMGSSAGALGTAVWSDTMLNTFTYEKAAVIMDSYMGVFPEGAQGPTIHRYEICNLPIMRPHRSACEDKTVTVQDILEYAIRNNPSVPFAHVQPKTDIVQQGFKSAIAASYGLLDEVLVNPGRFYADTNLMMERYAANSNYYYYLVDGSFHTFAEWKFWFSASTKGEWSFSPSTPSLAEWAEKIVANEGMTNECNGRRQPNGGSGYLFVGGYCYDKLFS
jgi:hypothetical protein